MAARNFFTKMHCVLLSNSYRIVKGFVITTQCILVKDPSTPSLVQSSIAKYCKYATFSLIITAVAKFIHQFISSSSFLFLFIPIGFLPSTEPSSLKLSITQAPGNRCFSRQQSRSQSPTFASNDSLPLDSWYEAAI